MDLENGKLYVEDTYGDTAVLDFTGGFGLGIKLNAQEDGDEELYVDLDKETTIAVFEYIKKNMEECGWL